MSRAPWAIPIVTFLAVIALGGATVWTGWTPTIPDGAGSTIVANVALTGEIAPDVTDDVDPETIPRSPSGSACLDPIERPAGTMKLCWDAYRDPHDGDPDQDYYHLRISSTFGGEAGTGARWAVIGARLVGTPSNQVFETWPAGVLDGPCRQVDVAMSLGRTEGETVCGRTTATADTADWSQRVAWTCTGCLVADHADRALTLRQVVAVPEGTVPGWEITADLGG